jgi:poly(hydroxyalkanoate) depolymerase family esterase
MSSLRARWWPRPGREAAPGAAAGRWDRYVDNGPNSSRAYAVYTPAGLKRHQSVPLVVVLHGCKQSGAEAALGTDVNAYADRAGFVALYPEQSVRDNPQLCWNWFRPGHQSRGLGEPAAIARITEQVLSGRHSRGGPRLDRNRVHVMGLSAGGAMAGVLAATYPDVYASAGIHSAPQYGAARSTLTAVMAMRSGGPDPERQGRLAHAAMGPWARVVPVMVIQGDADMTVWTSNGDSVVRQWLATSRLAAGGQVSDRPAGDGDDGDEGSGLDFSRPDTSEVLSSPGGLSYRVSCWNDDAGRPVVRYWLVGDLGHAWSGGVSAGSYTDSRGPNATEAMVTFFGQCARDRDRASLAVRPPRPGSRDRSGRFRAGTARLRDWAVGVRNSSGRVRDSLSGVRDGERSGSGMVTNPDRRSS